MSVALLTMVLSSSARASPSPPTGVSPGRSEDAALASDCPTFSWALSAGAIQYELVVYAIGSELLLDEEAEDRPALLQRVVGGATSWTPAFDRCLEPGETYAWSVRAISAEGASEWAPPLFFRTTLRCSEVDLPRASSDLQRPSPAPDPSELEVRAPAMPSASFVTTPRSSPIQRRLTSEITGAVDGAVARAGARTIIPITPPEFTGGGPTALRVAGEVRTVDPSGEPRLWGEGRPGAVIYGAITGAFCSHGDLRFGLSEIAVDWASAAAACPEGTWVCTGDDRQVDACNTGRPDGIDDSQNCVGALADLDPAAHDGWIADAADKVRGFRVNETGARFTMPQCAKLPVWCCFEP